MGELDDFLNEGAEQERPEEREAPQPEQKAPPPPADDGDDEGEPPAPQPGEPTIPRRAYEDERRKRQDWKAQAIEAKARAEGLAKYEAEAAELRRQLDEMRKAPPQPAPPPQQYQPPPVPQPGDFEGNPAGYVAALIQHHQEESARNIVALNFRNSEFRLRDRIGDEKVDALIREWGQAEAADPTLRIQLNQQADPFGWAYKQMQARRAQAEIGDDPAAYRAKLEAEIRAQLAAEAAGQPPVAPQRPGAPAPPRMQPSLANGRSVAGRSFVDDSPTPLEELFDGR